jgi:hypothetical protein
MIIFPVTALLPLMSSPFLPCLVCNLEAAPSVAAIPGHRSLRNKQTADESRPKDGHWSMSFQMAPWTTKPAANSHRQIDLNGAAYAAFRRQA